MRGLLRIFGAILLLGLGLFAFLGAFMFIPFDEVNEGAKSLEKVLAVGMGTAALVAAALLVRSAWRERPL